MKSNSAPHWHLLATLLICLTVMAGCNSKSGGPATQSGEDASSVDGKEADSGKLVTAPVANEDEGGGSASESQAPDSSAEDAKDEPVNPQDKNDDGIPDDAHVFDIPEGDNDVLLQFIAEVPGRMLSAEDEEEGGLAITTAAERVLKNSPTESQRRQAAEAMFNWLQRLQQMYAREADDVHLYWKMRLKDFDDTKDEQLEKILAPYRILNQAIGWHELRQDQRDEFAQQLPEYFQSRPLDDSDLETAQQVAEAVLKSGDRPAAIEMYKTLADILQNSPNAGIASEAKRLRGMAYRLESLGQPIDLQAMTLDGERLDWSSYRGKVVLIDFWATWCQPCLAEMPNIEKLYKIYHDRGFDVIGVSLDDDEEALKEFVKEHNVPWTVTFGFLKDAAGLDQPLAMQFGINSIPVALLVDQEGRLIALEARGEDLAAWLENLLGPADVAGAASASEPAENAAPAPAETTPPAEKPAE